MLLPTRADYGTIDDVVTIKGKALASGRVFFHLGKGQFVGATVKDGKYAVDRAPVGNRTITVEGAGVPPKYTSEEKAGLSYVVKGGRAIFDIALD